MNKKKTSKKITIVGNQKPFLDRNDTTEMYYNDIRKYNTLSESETFALLKEYMTANETRKNEIKNKLFVHNSRLVISMARCYCTANDNLNDLIQEGNIGLLNAIDRFKFERESSFQKFALYHIRREINLFKLNSSPIVQQTNRSKTESIVTKIRNEFVQREHRNPTDEEVLEEYNARSNDQKKVSDTQDVSTVEYVYIDSLDQSKDDFTDCQSYLDYTHKSCSFNSCLNDEEKEYNQNKLEFLMHGLSNKEKEAILLFYGFNTGFEESLHSIGTRMGCSSERVRQLCSSAIDKMQKKASYSFKL